MYMTFKILTGEEEETSRQQLGPSQENCKETTKTQPVFFIWRVKNLHAWNLTTMDEFDWHDILRTKETTRKTTVRCDQRDYQTWWYLHTHCQLLSHAAKLSLEKSSGWRHWKPPSILMGSSQQSMKISFLMEVILQELALAFPLLSSPSDLPSPCLLVPSFQHHSGNSSSLGWKDQRAQARPSKKGNANQYLDLEEEEEEEEERHLSKKEVVRFFQYLKCLLFQTGHGHSRTRKMSMYSNHQCSKSSFWCPLPHPPSHQAVPSKTSNAHGAQCGRFSDFTSRDYSWVYPLPAQFCPTKRESPHAIRKVELLAVPLVCHLAGITNRSHLMHKAFVEHSGKTCSGDCMSLTCIFIPDITNTRSCCSHPCTCHSLQVLWALVKKIAWCSALFPWYGIPPLDLKDCIRAVPLWLFLDASSPLGPVGYFLAQVELRKKRSSALFKHRAPLDISKKASDFPLHSLGAPHHLKKQIVLMFVCLPWARTLLGCLPCNWQMLFWSMNEGRRQIPSLFQFPKGPDSDCQCIWWWPNTFKISSKEPSLPNMIRWDFWSVHRNTWTLCLPILHPLEALLS